MTSKQSYSKVMVDPKTLVKRAKAKKNVQFSVYIDEGIKRAFMEFCAQSGVKQNRLFEEILKDFLKGIAEVQQPVVNAAKRRISGKEQSLKEEDSEMEVD